MFQSHSSFLQSYLLDLNTFQGYASLFIDTPSLEENEPFPEIYLKPLKCLWQNDTIQKARRRGNTIALHDNIS